MVNRSIICQNLLVFFSVCKRVGALRATRESLRSPIAASMSSGARGPRAGRFTAAAALENGARDASADFYGSSQVRPPLGQEG